MERSDIINNKLVLNTAVKKPANGIAFITNVRNANKSDRDELMYDLQYLVKDIYDTAIREYCNLTLNTLVPLTKEEALDILSKEDACIDIKISKFNRKRVGIVRAKHLINEK